MISYRISFDVIPLPFPVAEITWHGFDIDRHGQWLAVRDTGRELRLVTPWNEMTLHIERPHATVRWLGDKALVLGGRIRRTGEINAWIIDPADGAVLSAFSVGDGFEDVVVLRDYIVVSYFDEGVIGNIGPAGQGLAVFNHDGSYLWGYAGTIHDPVDVLDCYALCATGPNSLAFCAYTGFELVELAVDRQIQTVRPTPNVLRGSRALTLLKDTAFFHGPYPVKDQRFRDEVYVLKSTGHYDCIGSLAATQVRGLANGRMLTIGAHGLRIATISE